MYAGSAESTPPRGASSKSEAAGGGTRCRGSAAAGFQSSTPAEGEEVGDVDVSKATWTTGRRASRPRGWVADSVGRDSVDEIGREARGESILARELSTVSGLMWWHRRSRRPPSACWRDREREVDRRHDNIGRRRRRCGRRRGARQEEGGASDEEVAPALPQRPLRMEVHQHAALLEKRKETVLLRCSGVRFDGSPAVPDRPCFDARKVVAPALPILTSESYVTDHESNEPFAAGTSR